ncbi:unnamed protein product [Paramecium sonneborni]|uniref:Uncharacterized protein n=1 Tax=Paramecium sonneborni TaxID=65129 RepID=A0A8S1LN52_9CILI|nr:unnamed protein product [Paramecium sonneborni]
MQNRIKKQMWMYKFLMIFMLIRGEVAQIANEGGLQNFLILNLQFRFMAIFFFITLFIKNEFFKRQKYFALVIRFSDVEQTFFFLNIFTMILIVRATDIYLLEWNPQGSLIISGAMTIYIVFQTYSAQ